MDRIDSTHAPEPVGAYPHARKAGGLLFLSGIGPRKRGSSEIPGVTLDSDGNVMEDKFGLIELQSVYVSGNIRNPFRWFMEDQDNRGSQNYSGNNYPKPDYLSSSRKRLFPQVQYKYNTGKPRQQSTLTHYHTSNNAIVVT